MLAIAVVAIAGTACQSGTQPQTTEASGGAPEVSKQEYDAAFEEFRSCVAEGGGELLGVSIDPEFGTYQYRYTDEDRFLVDGCYGEHFFAAQIGYESHNEALLEADAEQNRLEWEREVLPCLRANGFDDVPANFDAVVSMPGDEARALHQAFTELTIDGSCDVTSPDE